MRMVDVRGPRSCCTATETNTWTQAWDHSRADTWMPPGCPSIVLSGPLKVTQERERVRGSGHVGTISPIQVGSRGLRWTRVRKVLSGPPHPGIPRETRHPMGLWKSKLPSLPSPKKGSTTHNQVRNSPPQMVLWLPRPKEKGPEPTNPGGWKGEYAGGRQGRCDNYHHQFKQTN